MKFKKKRKKKKRIYGETHSSNASEGALGAIFEEFGTVGRVSIATDRDTGQQRGFAFVEMDVEIEGKRAIEMLSGKELNGRPLTVNEARPKTDRGWGGGGVGGSRQNNHC